MLVGDAIRSVDHFSAPAGMTTGDLFQTTGKNASDWWQSNAPAQSARSQACWKPVQRQAEPWERHLAHQQCAAASQRAQTGCAGAALADHATTAAAAARSQAPVPQQTVRPPCCCPEVKCIPAYTFCLLDSGVATTRPSVNSHLLCGTQSSRHKTLCHKTLSAHHDMRLEH